MKSFSLKKTNQLRGTVDVELRKSTENNKNTNNIILPSHVTERTDREIKS